MAWGAVAGAAIGVVGGMMSSSSSSDAASGAANASAGATKYSSDVQKQIYDQTRQDQTPWRVGGQNALQRLLGGMGIDSPVSYSDQETRAQIYERLKPDFKITTTPSDANPYPWNPNYNPSDDPEYVAPKVQSTTSVDINALNKAVDEEMAKQGKTGDMLPRDSTFGTLAKNFSLNDYEADPGYAFRVSEGQKALERSAAARGGLYSGRAAKDLTRFGQDQGSQEYQNAYNRYQSNQNNQYNRLASLAGVGQTANNALASAGQNYANSVGSLAMTNAANQGNAALAAGNARSSGYTGIANALGGINWGKTSTPSASGGLTPAQSAAYAQSNPNGYDW